MRLLLPLSIVASLSIPAAGPAPAPPSPLRFGAVSVYNPRAMYVKYQPLVDLLQKETATPWKLVFEPTYDAAIQDLCSGELTAALIGPYTYARAREKCAVLPIARLRTHGKVTYQGLIMVRVGSGFRSLKDLSGTCIGLGAPMSTASTLVARAMLVDAGLRVGVDVSCRNYAHHEQAARAVLLGEVDACAVRDIVGEQFVARQALRVLARSEEIPNFPLVLSPRAPAKLGGELARLLTSARAGAVMKDWDEELSGGFAATEDRDYDPIRKLALRIFGSAGLTVKGSALTCPLEQP